MSRRLVELIFSGLFLLRLLPVIMKHRFESWQGWLPFWGYSALILKFTALSVSCDELTKCIFLPFINMIKVKARILIRNS